MSDSSLSCNTVCDDGLYDRCRAMLICNVVFQEMFVEVVLDKLGSRLVLFLDFGLFDDLGAW